MKRYENSFPLIGAGGFAYSAGWTDGNLFFSWTHRGLADFELPEPDSAVIAAMFGDSYDDWVDKVGETLAQGLSFSWGHSLRLPDGSVRSVCHVLAPNRDGTVAGMLIPFDDSVSDKLGYLESLPVGVYLLDEDYRIQWTNDLGTRQSHINWKQHYGELCYAYPFGRGTPCVDCPVSKTFADGGHHLSIRDMPNGDTWLISSVPAIDRHGNRTGAIEVVVDISEATRERSLAMNELRDKERRLSLQMAALQRTHAFYTYRGNKLLDNPGSMLKEAVRSLRAGTGRFWLRNHDEFTCICQYDANTGLYPDIPSIPECVLRFFRESRLAETQLAVPDVLESNFSPELRAYYKDDNIRALLFTPVRLGSETLGFLTVADYAPRDWHTEDKGFALALADFVALCISRQRLEEKQAQIDTLMGNLPGVAFRMRYGPNGPDFAYLSDSCRRFMGFSLEDARADPAIMSRIITEEDFPTFHALHAAPGRAGETLEFMFRISLEGRTHWIMEKSRIIESNPDTGEQIFEGFAHDVTERMQLRAAELASEAKSSFLASMSHEIRTPLNAVTGFLYLLRKTGLNEEQAGYVAKITTAGSALLEIINAVLDFSKIEAGKMRIAEEPFNLDVLLDNINAIFSQLVADKGISLEFSLEDTVPRTLSGDPGHIRQVLINLINNAVKFTTEGSVSVRCSLAPGSEKEPHLKFSVTDTGIGMSREFLEKIFSPFEQADGSVSRRHGGTGLGLSIAKSLAELMHGGLEVRSEQGKGSVFSFTCRVKELHGVTIVAPEEIQEVPDFGDHEVLLVEDNEINREIALALLRDTRLRVREAENGAEAVKMISTAPPSRYSLILMDIQMPVMDGLQATRRIRMLPGMSDIPIIAMTAHALDTEIDKCIKAGMNTHISKPLDVRKFYSVLSRYFDGARAS